MKKLSMLICAMLLVFGVVGTANSALIDRGGGMIYDSDQDITWLQDANLAATETFGVSEISVSVPGWMNYYWASVWIDAMNAAMYKGYNNWRLPSTDLSGDAVYGYDGTTTSGYNITSSEMGYMFYENLGNLGYRDENENYVNEGGLRNTGPFSNVQEGHYWSGTTFNGNMNYNFGFDSGVQRYDSVFYEFFAWPVRDGNVAAVPIPSAIWLLGSGLIGLVGFRRKYRR